MKLGTLLSAFGVVLFTYHADAAQMSSYCYAPLSDLSKIEGKNIEKRMPIASVSKMVTAYWAVKDRGAQYRFQTLMYITPVGEDIYDLHMQGSRDPYFGAEQLHHVISNLNEKGIKKIRKFTYDENFKFVWFIDDEESNTRLAYGFYDNYDPRPNRVYQELQKYNSFLQGYDETRDKAQKRNIKLLENIEFTVETFEYLPAKEFVAPSQHTKIFSVNSVPLQTLLKEMNRNSNNHAANQIFEHMGSASKFSSFIENALGLKSQDIVMLNGSGDRVNTAQGPRYNESSCLGMLKILADLHTTLSEQNSSLSQIATVIGTDPGSATNLYSNDTLFDGVIAKTGTVNPAVTLAGLISTQNGPYLFMYNVDPQRAFSHGRQIIRQELSELMRDLGGKVRLKGRGFTFVSFDNKSFSEVIPVNAGAMP